MENVFLDEVDINDSIEYITNEIKKKQLLIDDIVAIARGGYIPARYLAKTLNIRKLYSIGVESYNDKTREEISFYQIPILKEHQNILVVDDIIDSGQTMVQTLAYFKEKFCPNNIYTCSIHYKPQSSIFKPDIFYKEVNEQTWITYPWE